MTTPSIAGLPFEDLKFVYVELTVRCNLRCHFCDNEIRNLYRDIRVEDFRRIVDQLQPGTRMGLHGLGEPTLHKNLVELVAYAKARGMYVYFNTNHTVTTEQQMQGLVEHGLDELRISMSAGRRETFATYAERDLFDALLARTRRMVEIRGTRRKPLLRIVFVLTRESYAEFPAVLAHAEELGVDQLLVQTHLDWGKASVVDGNTGDGFHVEELEAARRTIVAAAAAARRVDVVLPFPTDGPLFDPAPEPGRCQWPFDATWITADGEVTPCCNLHDPRQVRFGNAFRERLDRIWLSEAYQDFRARYRRNAVPECRSCPVNYGRFKMYPYDGSGNGER